jgi:hypothetical protein
MITRGLKSIAATWLAGLLLLLLTGVYVSMGITPPPPPG